MPGQNTLRVNTTKFEQIRTELLDVQNALLEVGLGSPERETLIEIERECESEMAVSRSITSPWLMMIRTIII